MKLIKRVALYLIFAYAPFGWAFEVDCYNLERGEAKQKQSPRFTTKRGCDQTSEQCDMHKRLGIMRHEFDAAIVENMLDAFDQCHEQVLAGSSSSAQRKAATLLKNKEAFRNASENVIQLSNKVVKGNELLSQLLWTLEEYERMTNNFSDKAVDASTINQLIQKSEEITEISQALDAFHTEHKLRDNEFFPSSYYDIQARVNNTKDAVGNALEQPLSALEVEIYEFRSRYTQLEYKSSWSVSQLTDYQKNAINVTNTFNGFVKDYGSVLGAAEKSTQERVANAQKFTKRISGSLVGIDEAISTSGQREKAKLAREEISQAFLDSLSTRNMVLVASELGYGNGFLDDYFPFYMYLGCLSDKYRDYLFQGFTARKSDGSRNFVVKLYSGQKASNDSLAVHLEFTQVLEGRYVTVKADEYESGLSKASQVAKVTVSMFKQCQEKYSL